MPTRERPDIGSRIWDWSLRIDVLVFALQIIAAVFVGFFVVGTWIARLWTSQSWWHLFLLSGTSLLLLVGFIRELCARRIGPFGIVVLGFAFVFGAAHLLDGPAP
jgi:hypothetical protein